MENVSNSSSVPDQLSGSCDELFIGETRKKIPNKKITSDIVVIAAGKYSLLLKIYNARFLVGLATA
jgi:hypothetical protein